MENLLNVFGTPLLWILGFIVVVLLISFVANRWRVANANEAIIVAGARGSKLRDEKGQDIAGGDKGLKVVVGGGTLVLPLIHRVGRLKLTARQIAIQLNDAVTSQGIKVQVLGVATFKIGRDVESIRNAAERFLDAKDEQVDSIVKNVLEGSLRSIVGTLTIEELIMDRSKLMNQVQESAKADLATTGLLIDSFTIQSINDESGYVDLLGRQKLAIVERDARIAQATSDQEAAVREAEADQVKLDAQRNVALRRAEIEAQTAAADAKAEQSGPLASAEAIQDVVRRQTDVALLEADRKEKELLSSVVRPASANAQALVEKAEGDKRSQIVAAEADAERVRLQAQAEAQRVRFLAEADAERVRLQAQAEAERIRLAGVAEADATRAKGEAEATALALKADAFQKFNDAAVLQSVLEALPGVVRAAAEPMSAIGSMTVISNDGASEVVRNATRTVTDSVATIKGLTGMDLTDLVQRGMEGAVSRAGGDITQPRASREPAASGGGRGSAEKESPARPAPLAGPPTVTARVPEAEAVRREAAALAEQVRAGQAAMPEVTPPQAAPPQAAPAPAPEPVAAPEPPPAPEARVGSPAPPVTPSGLTADDVAAMIDQLRDADKGTLRGLLETLERVGLSDEIRSLPVTQVLGATPSIQRIANRLPARIRRQAEGMTIGDFYDRFAPYVLRK